MALASSGEGHRPTPPRQVYLRWLKLHDLFLAEGKVIVERVG